MAGTTSRKPLLFSATGEVIELDQNAKMQQREGKKLFDPLGTAAPFNRVIKQQGNYMANEINTETALLTCFDNYVLIEIPFFGDLKRLNETLFKLLNMGYLPILAHPERYTALQTTKEVEDLKQKGVHMQLNALSLIGFYGRQIQKKASLWLQKGLYDFIGTDAHDTYQLTKLKEIHLSKKEHTAWNQICEKQVMLINN